MSKLEKCPFCKTGKGVRWNNEMGIVEALRRLGVETGSLACLGCGHEHSCGIRGCAIIRDAAGLIEVLSAQLTEAQGRESQLMEERRLLKQVCGGLSCLLKGIDGRMIYDKVLPMARASLERYYAKYPPSAAVALDNDPQETGEGDNERM